MPPSTNKVAPDDNAALPQSLDEAKALVDALIKVVACYRHLSSCVGGCTDGTSLRDELRRTRERAQELAVANRQCLTARLRDKTIGEEERRETELLWVAFSSSLEMLHADMCKVFHVGKNFPLSKTALVQTGIQGETTEVAARALSLKDLNHNDTPASVERLEQSDLEAETAHVDQMIEDMEQKVNVLRWTVEAQGPLDGDTVSTDSAPLALLCTDEEDPGRVCDRSQMFMASVLGGVFAVAVLISVSAVYML
ncbi:regulator of G-protein signaling 9-binding protein B-like [Megalops cyprinoides]|uniref:regulator of G-protein signaling 9-binding protein B-like n=1 Tax=Megalops cyprinoides TaxID=118141 RepID=UPI0018646D81|nr:regulator of G-protein signaling 9-binding protein B-like [Megalops cyprinoides]